LPTNLAEFAIEFRGLRKDVGKCFEAIRDAEDEAREARGGAAQGAQGRPPLDVRRGDLRRQLVIAAIALLVPH
jgi:hypothetical protein